jgi:hypothetical protein
MPVSFTVEGDAPADYVNILIEPGYLLSLERLAADPAFQPNPRAWEQYAGTYENPLTKLTIKLDGDQMTVSSPLFQNVDFPMKAIDETRFLFPIGLLTFESPDSVRLGAAIRFTRTPTA